ncbi:MAG: hypothetical protein R2737_13160 [Candidatus Nanopelagicales bacterium]
MNRPARAALIAPLLLLLALVGLTGVASPAYAATLDQVASALESDPVYNDPAAENALTTAQADQLSAQIRDTGVPIYVAVLPESFAAENGGSADSALVAIQGAVGRNGVYAVIVGNSFRAGSTSGTVRDLADQAFAANRSAGPYAVLSDFVALAGERYGSGGTGSGSSTSGSSGSSGFPVGLLVFGGALVLGVGALIWFGVRTSRKAATKRLEEVKEVVDEDVTEFGERLAAFDTSDSRLDEAGRADMQTALDSYSRARDASEAMRSDADAANVTSALEDGRFALACVQARLDGTPLPQRRPPCFVDPRHGPSVEDVEWAPDGGAPRPVPVCFSCAATLKSGSVPAAREVPAATGGGRVPYWQAGRQYAPYASGYYSSFGNVLPALLMGTMLGSMMAGPTVIQHDPTAGTSGGGFGGGDFGGGGFGGGDFGGGGGDFGGGDF